MLMLFVFTASWSSVFVFTIGYRSTIYSCSQRCCFRIRDILVSAVQDAEPLLFPEDSIIILFLFLLLPAALYAGNHKVLNYVLAYYFVFEAGYLLLRVVFMVHDTKNSLLTANAFGVIFTSLYVVLEFLLFILFDVDIQAMLYRTREATALVTVGVRRAYGLSTEPTQVGFYLCTLGPIAGWSIIRRFGEKKS